jgi:hypothetical protein
MDILLYRHSDGYPGTADGKEYGVLTDIIPFLKSFRKYRGDDVMYCGAQLLHHLMKELDKSRTAMTKRIRKIRPLGDQTEAPDYSGHGISKAGVFQTDLDYYYAVYPEEVQVFDVTGHGPKDWRKIKTVKIVATKRVKAIMDVACGRGRADIVI